MSGWIGVICGFVLLFPLFGNAGNSKREQEYNKFTELTLKSGEMIQLQAQGMSFYAIYDKTLHADRMGAVVVLHDRGAFPDQSAIIHNLRVTLPQHRWSTLSVQMPIRENGASEQEYFVLFPEARTRIAAAVTFLRKAEEETIVIVGYGLGALMGLNYIDHNPQAVEGYVAISLGVPRTSNTRVQTLAFLKRTQFPVLDIYAEHDLPEVINSAGTRQLAAKNNPKYRQDKINTAFHSYQHNEEFLVKRVYGWLSKTFRNP